MDEEIQKILEELTSVADDLARIAAWDITYGHRSTVMEDVLQRRLLVLKAQVVLKFEEDIADACKMRMVSHRDLWLKARDVMRERCKRTAKESTAE